MQTQLITTTAARRGVVSARTLVCSIVLLVALALSACGGPDDVAPVARPTTPVDRLVGIAAGRLHVRCDGHGDATVLLIAGWDNSSDTWSLVQPAIAEHARVCSYDRFGTGTSDAPTKPQTFATQVADLRELLTTIGEPGPYVVVGHSFGGAEAVTFAATYPDDVAGLMLVDASPSTWPSTVCSVPAYSAGCDVMHHPAQGERLDVFPAFDAVAKISSLDDLPMTVMTAAHRSSDGITPAEHDRLDTLWRQGTERWAALSSTSTVVTVDHTGHEIQVEHPDTVIAEITKLLPR